MTEATPKPPQRYTYTLWGALALALLLGILTLVRMMHADAEQLSTADGNWVAVVPQLLENQLGLVGRIEASSHMTLAAPFDGVIKELNVTPGQQVERAQRLLTLDTTQLDIELRQALADLLKARRTVQELQNWAHGPEVARGRRTLSTAQLSLSDTESKLADTRALLARGIVARMEVDALQQQLKMQRLDLQAARSELAETEAKGRGEYREIADMELANAQARHQSLSHMHSMREIVAPFAGVAIRPATRSNEADTVKVQVGARVTQGTPLYELVNHEQLQASAQVDEVDLHQLGLGQQVSVSGDGFAGLTLSGRIEAIGVQGHAADTPGAGATYDVLVAIDVPDPQQRQRIRLGMSARLAVITYRNAQAIAVPPSALRRDAAGQTVVRFRPTLQQPAREVPVTVGQAVATGVEVHGLEAGFVER